MADIPESLLRRSAEAKAKALGVPVEQVLAEMKGEAPPASASTEPESSSTPPAPSPEPSAAEPAPLPASGGSADPGLLARAAAAAGAPESIVKRSAEAKAKALGVAVDQVLAEMAGEAVPASATAAPEPAPAAPEPAPAAPEPAPAAPPAAVAVGEAPPAGGGSSGNGNGKVAATVVARPTAPPANAPEGIRTQRLLTVVKARAIQQVKAEPSDKVNTWPHLMIAEFTALLAITGFLVILSSILQAPLLEPANFNATPNPSKAPWYFLGLQELLSYFDPQIAGVTVPTIIGLIGFMAIPYVDRNPSTKPSDRKFAIMLYSFFLAGSAILTIIGVLFRGRGFNWAYPWRDGIFFDDLKDWIHFE
jgi:menaquinol-cytochrome c reductase cytochrome b/c subunit